MADKASYIMDDEREASRLEGKVDAQQWAKRYIFPLVKKTPVDILEVGCGPGHLASAVSECLTEARVTGVDGSEKRIEAARLRGERNSRLDFVLSDARKLEFADDSFDLVYTRFMLEYLPDPQRAIKEFVRVCRPGGKVLLQDLDGQLVWHYPEDQELQSRIEKVLTKMKETGFDPMIGRKLFSFAQHAGLTGLDVKAESYHLYAGTIDAENERLWQLKMDIAEPQIAAALGGSQTDAKKLTTDFMNWLRRKDTLTYSIVFTVTGTKPG